MGFTNHPDGLTSFGIPVLGGGPWIPVNPWGNYFFVSDAVGNDGYEGKSPSQAFATIDAAINKATSGDVIIVAAGHTETISGATTLVMDEAGVRIVGLGIGSLRPTLTFSATDSIINISAANCSLENMLLVGNVDNIVTGISLAAGADGTLLHGIEMRDGASDEEFLVAIAIAAACTDVIIDGFVFHGLAGGMTNCIVGAGAADRLKLINSFIRCDASAEAVDFAAAASVDVVIAHNRVINIDTAAGLGMAFHNSTTGWVDDNHVSNLKDTVAGITGTGLHYGENYASNALGAQGILVPGADS